LVMQALQALRALWRGRNNMRIAINLATRPFADLGPALKRLRIGMGILALVAIAFGLGLHAVHNRAEQARQRERSVDAQIARVTQERQSYQILMDRPDNSQLLKQSEALNRLFDEKAFSWTLAMENLETVLPGGVQVSTLEPVRAKDGHITLHLRVVGPRDRSVTLVRNLEHSRRFFEPRIIGETSESNNLPNQRMEAVSASNRFTFDLLAEYNPPTLEETKATSKPAKTATAERGPQHSAAPHTGAPTTGALPAGAMPATAAPAQRRPARPPYTGPTTGGPR
jgi:type IV pilus assembly protein PilN